MEGGVCGSCGMSQRKGVRGSCHGGKDMGSHDMSRRVYMSGGFAGIAVM